MCLLPRPLSICARRVVAHQNVCKVLGRPGKPVRNGHSDSVQGVQLPSCHNELFPEQQYCCLAWY